MDKDAEGPGGTFAKDWNELAEDQQAIRHPSFNLSWHLDRGFGWGSGFTGSRGDGGKCESLKTRSEPPFNAYRICGSGRSGEVRKTTGSQSSAEEHGPSKKGR